jgi:hypothetical protein
MHDITKHDTKEEWEGYTGKYSWVDLLVSWDTIGVNDHLWDGCEVIQDEMGWSWHTDIFWTFLDIESILPFGFNLVDCFLKVLLSWNPSKTLIDHTILVDVVQMNVDLLLSQDE